MINKDRIEIRDYQTLMEYLKKGAVVTLAVDNQKINIIRKVKIPQPVLLIQHYGEYPLELALTHLTSRYNLKVYVYRQPPQTEDCEITRRLLDFWIKGA